ncbi:hypothetical protein IC620_05900 [Hazenella sp. IB182357]|uniref:Uncharacterized protein n=1 Tax=Polycladospora coralii TaxID=2771432 RepID=A0A926N6C5_9BACL|nr:hypothetical protein [Polycladospora coralii]MBD1371891.1 hypothetical protein [Polycladospora coralii]MBS7529352.1 hypothetical protein [Polycladospora coralii]
MDVIGQVVPFLYLSEVECRPCGKRIKYHLAEEKPQLTDRFSCPHCNQTRQLYHFQRLNIWIEHAEQQRYLRNTKYKGAQVQVLITGKVRVL